MGTKITIDPITRIEGHLKIEVEVAGGKGCQCLELRHHVQGYRTHFAGPGSPGCPSLCTAFLRGLNLHPCPVLGEGS